MFKEDYEFNNGHFLCESPRVLSESKHDEAMWQWKLGVSVEAKYLCSTCYDLLPSRGYTSDWDSPENPSMTTLASCILAKLGGPVCCSPKCWLDTAV